MELFRGRLPAEVAHLGGGAQPRLPASQELSLERGSPLQRPIWPYTFEPYASSECKPIRGWTRAVHRVRGAYRRTPASRAGGQSLRLASGTRATQRERCSTPIASASPRPVRRTGSPRGGLNIGAAGVIAALLVAPTGHFPCPFAPWPPIALQLEEVPAAVRGGRGVGHAQGGPEVRGKANDN